MLKKNNDKHLLSIIIPVFNRQQGLNRLMADLKKAMIHHQLDQQIEIIIIDDASSSPITLPDVPCDTILKRNSNNSGAPFSRARGLRLSRGRFIHFHDSDDSVSESWLFELTQELSQHPEIDLLVTGRIDYEHHGKTRRYPKFFHKHVQHPRQVLGRLIYWNCIGPMGGVTFSRKILEQITIKKLASCQDWQMYIDALKKAKMLRSRPDILFLFYKTGNDRISHNAQKKILGHLQLSRQTATDSIFGRKIRLFYLYACKQHIFNQGGRILQFYKKKPLIIFATFLIIAAYSFIPSRKK